MHLLTGRLGSLISVASHCSRSIVLIHTSAVSLSSGSLVVCFLFWVFFFKAKDQQKRRGQLVVAEEPA